jgi:protein-S-isoprenylcysteine O-methyltransferase Ste14
VNSESSQPSPTAQDISRGVRRRIVQLVVQYSVVTLILFGCAGRWDWAWGWVFIAVSVGTIVVNAFLLPRELMAERAQTGENVKPWDRTITRLASVTGLATMVVAGLDARFTWTPPLPLWIHLAGLVLMILGAAGFTWAMRANRFFSSQVRIQTDRGHTVASGGPYRFVRHPGYVAYITTTLGSPLVLGSLWALVPAGLTTILFIARTALEDRTLQAELPGYPDYAARVRYRLVPGAW